MKRGPLFDITFLQAVSKQYITTKQQKKACKLGTMYIFEVKKSWKFNNSYDVITSKLGQKGTKFVYYILTVIKKIKFNNYVFAEVTNSFLRPVL